MISFVCSPRMVCACWTSATPHAPAARYAFPVWRRLLFGVCESACGARAATCVFPRVRRVLGVCLPACSYADVVVLNKCDLVPAAGVREAVALVRGINASARLIGARGHLI